MDTSTFNEEFENCRGQLKAYLIRITASVQDTEDIVQDTWIRASNKLETFKGNSSIKTWIFAIASNLAKDNLKASHRWTEDVTDICKQAAMSNQAFFQEAMQIRQTSSQGQFEIREHISFCFTCISKSLPLEQQICLLLKEVHGFKISEIAEIVNITEAMTKYYLHTSRSKMADIFEGRCALINKKGTCHQCSELNGIFNPKQDAAVELNKIDLVKAAKTEDKNHLLKLRTEIVKMLDPFESDAAELQKHHLEHNRSVMENLSK